MSVNAGQRHIPDTPGTKSLYACDKARELAAYTQSICSNEKVFLPKYADTTNDIVRTAREIYLSEWEANNVMVGNDLAAWIDRKKRQREAASMCNRLLALIGLAKPLYHLRGKQFRHWSELTVDTRSLLRAWMEADRKRYGHLEKQ